MHVGEPVTRKTQHLVYVNFRLVLLFSFCHSHECVFVSFRCGIQMSSPDGEAAHRTNPAKMILWDRRMLFYAVI